MRLEPDERKLSRPVLRREGAEQSALTQPTNSNDHEPNEQGVSYFVIRNDTRKLPRFHTNGTNFCYGSLYFTRIFSVIWVEKEVGGAMKGTREL
jgi:hypothetical protein